MSEIVQTVVCAQCGERDISSQMYRSADGLICDHCQVGTELAALQEWTPVGAFVKPLPWLLLWLPESYNWILAGSAPVEMFGSALWVLWGPIWIAAAVAGPWLIRTITREAMVVWSNPELDERQRWLQLAGHGWHLAVYLVVVLQVLALML